jgi:hypothetical protein
MADSVAPPRRSSRGTIPEAVSTNSVGQTEAQYDAARAQILRQEVDPISDNNVAENQNISTGDNNIDVEQTLEELVAAARASGQAARYTTSRKILLQQAMDILHSQGDNMTWECEEITALDLSELELKTLMRQYALQPQKVSLPGTSAPVVPSRLRLTENLRRLTGHISAADATAFQNISDKLGKEDIEMNLLVDDEARFTISSTLEAKAPYLDFPEDWQQWEVKWGHRELAKIVTLIWGKDSDSTHISIGDELRAYDLQMDSPKMHINNTR